MSDDGDALSDLDPILAAADTSASPWIVSPEDEAARLYKPDYDLARQLLTVPISQGAADEQTTGRVAKALDAWIAYELRRAGFPDGAVWPRASRPRVLSADLAPVEDAIVSALARIEDFEGRLARHAQEAAEKGLKKKPPSPYRLRPAIHQIAAALPGAGAANILGRFYVKQVDVVVSSWERGPDVLISTKTQFSSYLNNKNNRYEEAVGEITNLRDRHPMAAMGFAFLVRGNLLDEQGAYAYLRDLLVRLRKPDGSFDATMLLVGEWDDETLTLSSVESPAPQLSGSRFFDDLLGAVMRNTPVDLHQEIRRRRQGEPLGGLPPTDEAG
jgi:hypothetical protein